MAQTWHAVASTATFPDDGKLAVQVGGWSVLVVRLEDGYRALNDRCTHQAAMLSPGRIRRGAIMCPLHGARFDVDSGQCIGGAYAALRCFDVRLVDETIEVAVPDAPPGPAERPAPA